MPVPACRGRPECQKDRSRTHTQAGDGLSLDLRTFYQGQNKTPPKISGVCQQSEPAAIAAGSFVVLVKLVTYSIEQSWKPVRAFPDSALTLPLLALAGRPLRLRTIRIKTDVEYIGISNGRRRNRVAEILGNERERHIAPIADIDRRRVQLGGDRLRSYALLDQCDADRKIDRRRRARRAHNQAPFDADARVDLAADARAVARVVDERALEAKIAPCRLLALRPDGVGCRTLADRDTRTRRVRNPGPRGSRWRTDELSLGIRIRTRAK